MIHATAPDDLILPAGGVPSPLASWLTGTFLPFWAERARAGTGPGYVESVRADGSPLPDARRTTLVTARLVHCFSLGHVLSPGGSCLAAAEHGMRFLLESCRLPDGRFAHLARDDGPECAPEADLYDFAFVLLAFAAYAGASGQRAPRDLARRMADDLDTRLAHPAGGYRDVGGDGPLRRQFPHMHLFEAFQLHARIAPGTGWEERCEVILDIVEHRLVARDGSIAEWYAPDWGPAPGAAGSVREIGHQYEWAWLLYRHAATSGSTRAAALGDRLYRFGAAATGLHDGLPSGPVPNAIDGSCRPLGPTRPLWPLTEVLRATLMAEIAGHGQAPPGLADACVERIFERYLAPGTGLWINETTNEGHPVRDDIPLRVLYHLLPALALYCQEREVAFTTPSPLFDRPAISSGTGPASGVDAPPRA